MTPAAELGSRLATGSSATINRGSWASARDRDPLLLPAGERVGALERVIEHADTLQAFERPELVRALEAAEYAAPGR